MCNRKRLCVCVCVRMLLMSWEAGQLCKKIEASWWGVVTTLWWPRFRTQTHTHKEVDQVYAMRSGRCVGRGGWRENTRQQGGKSPLTFSMDPYWSAVVTTGWTQACHLGNRWSVMFCCGQQTQWRIKSGATVTNKGWKVVFGVWRSWAEVRRSCAPKPIDCPRFVIFITYNHAYKAIDSNYISLCWDAPLSRIQSNFWYHLAKQAAALGLQTPGPSIAQVHSLSVSFGKYCNYLKICLKYNINSVLSRGHVSNLDFKTFIIWVYDTLTSNILSKVGFNQIATN